MKSLPRYCRQLAPDSDVMMLMLWSLLIPEWFSTSPAVRSAARDQAGYMRGRN